MKNDSIALGFFDGVHKGHAEVLQYAKDFSVKNRGMFYATTFTDEISDFTSKKEEYITTFETRIENLKKFGATPAILPSDGKFFEMSAQEFIRYIIDIYNPSCVVCGENFRFGKNRSGDVDLLKRTLPELGVAFKAFPLYKTASGNTVSTTYIKNLIKQNDFQSVDNLMIYTYNVSGLVQKCTQTGTAIGFPTANLIPKPTQFLPEFGVYAGLVETEDGIKKSIINVGCRPTYDDFSTKIECHYLDDFSGNKYYGQKISVRFVAKIRDIIKFNDSSDLVAQLNKDKEAAYRYLRGEK